MIPQMNPQYTLIRKENDFMIKEKDIEKDEVEAKEAPPVNMSVEQVLNLYPIDREKARDVVMIDVSKNLLRIADSLDMMVKLKIQKMGDSHKEQSKDEKI